ncbi:hypothetical protein RvY_15339 [Ramazzottius varieornatus]|uniref:Uncharacterized protein n=1 Tax=Ramazzottius varieornatus TaxID=947166 RepID=A0A1D1VUJ9_RAMVA|nr:hypothetical protein RvY_15339 [Ramazzottius varieornatus]
MEAGLRGGSLFPPSYSHPSGGPLRPIHRSFSSPSLLCSFCKESRQPVMFRPPFSLGQLLLSLASAKRKALTIHHFRLWSDRAIASLSPVLKFSCLRFEIVSV